MVERLILPHGEILRDFLAQPGVSRSDLRRIVRQRGIFLSSDDKPVMIPAIMRTGLTPAEFEGLLLSIEKREDNPKFSSQSIGANLGSIESAISIVSEHFNFEPILNTDYKNYRFKGTPSFAMLEGDPEAVEVVFAIERSDFSKSIAKNVVIFDGKVTLRRNHATSEFLILNMHTSRETKEVCDAIAIEIIRALKTSGSVEADLSPTKVKFSNFSNAGRVKFLIGLATSASSGFLTFQSINDVGFKPAQHLERPQELDWLENNIKNARFRGSGLDQIAIIRNSDFHDHIELFRLDAEFEYKFDSYSGTCSLSFDFPAYTSDDDFNAELIVTVSRVRNFDVDSLRPLDLSGVSKISEKIRAVVDAQKTLLHKSFAKPARIKEAEVAE